MKNSSAISAMTDAIKTARISEIVSPDQDWCRFGVRDPVILTNCEGFPVKFNGLYRLFFSGRDRNVSEGGRTQIGWAFSDDLINWTTEPKPVFCDGDYAASGSVIKLPSGRYRIYYSFDTLKGLRYAETEDFSFWEINEAPILTPGQYDCHRIGLPNVFVRDGIWFLLAEGLNTCFSIVGAISFDGKSWSPLANGEPLYFPEPENWDNISQANPSISHSPKYPDLLFYNGNLSASDWDIGVSKTGGSLLDFVTGIGIPFLCRLDINASGGRLEGARLVKSSRGHSLFYFVLPSENSYSGGRIFSIDVPESVLTKIYETLNEKSMTINFSRVMSTNRECDKHISVVASGKKTNNLKAEEVANDLLAEKYFEIWDNYPIQQYTNNLEGNWLKELVKPGETVLLLGSGGGREIEHLLFKQAKITAFDLSQKMLDKGMSRFPNSGITWVKGDAQNPPPDLGLFDHVLALGLVFCYLQEPKKAATEIMKHILPGGTITLGVANSEHFTESVSRKKLADGRVRNGFTCGELISLLTDAGYKNPKVKGHRFFVDGLYKELANIEISESQKRDLLNQFLSIEKAMADVLQARAAKQLWVTATKPM